MNKEKLRQKAKNIKLLAMDVDGVLTDGSIILMASGEEVKIWNAKDRLGIFIARNAGALKFAWISGRSSRQVSERAKELKIDCLYMGTMGKKKAFYGILKKLKLKAEEAAYIGDDLIDIPVMKEAGFSACPGDACGEAKQCADYVTAAVGGRGVLREVIEVLLKSKGIWEKSYMKFLEDKARPGAAGRN